MTEDILKKQLLYRSLYRGCKETEILLGEFARLHLDHMNAQELREYEEVVELYDNVLYKYLVGQAPLPANNLMLQRIKEWGERRKSNPRPREPQSRALTN